MQNIFEHMGISISNWEKGTSGIDSAHIMKHNPFLTVSELNPETQIGQKNSK